MRVLLDSCVLVWWLNNPQHISTQAQACIANPNNEVLFSAASVWELGLKISKGKLRMPHQFADILLSDGFSPLSITVQHASRSLLLPTIHHDPFDRLLIAQALEEGLIFITRDENILAYPFPVIAA